MNLFVEQVRSKNVIKLNMKKVGGQLQYALGEPGY